MLNEGDFIISQDNLTRQLCLSRISFLENDSDNVLATTFISAEDSTKFFIEIPELVEANTSHTVLVPTSDISFLKASNEYR